MKEEHVVDKHQPALCKPSVLLGRQMGLWHLLTACPTVEKNPFKIRAAMKDSKLIAAPHHAAVQIAKVRNQNRTGARPKYAENMTVTMPPAPSMNRLPTREWFTVVCGRFHVPWGLQWISSMPCFRSERFRSQEHLRTEDSIGRPT